MYNWDQNINDEGDLDITDEKLRALLEQLHAELERTQAVDEKGRELLGEVSADIRSLIEREGETERNVNASIIRRWQTAIGELEIAHPTITLALSEIMTILSNAGI